MTEPAYVTAKQAAAALLDLKVTPALVRRWVSDGWLKRATTIRPEGHGQATAVFDVLDLWKAYNRWRDQPGASARRGPRLPRQ